MNQLQESPAEFDEIDRLMTAGDTKHGLARLESLARKGGVAAHYKLGCELKELRHPGCFLWFLSAAEMGHMDAAHMLGTMYLLGDPLGVHPKKAMKWFTQASLAGHARSQFSLAAMYEKGIGCPASKSSALEWYSKAADQGDAGAKLFAEQIKSHHYDFRKAGASAIHRLKSLLTADSMRR